MQGLTMQASAPLPPLVRVPLAGRLQISSPTFPLWTSPSRSWFSSHSPCPSCPSCPSLAPPPVHPSGPRP
eukprot:2677102-Pyramimonas_sp.AAC.1